MPNRILITGAGGMIARDLVEALQDRYTLRLTDRVRLRTDHDFVQADLTDIDALDRACDGVDAVVHLGAATWEYDVHDVMIPANITGTWNIFEAARRAGVGRLVFASTHHTVGFHHVDGTLNLTEAAEPRPDTFYAVTKLYGEALARYFSERYGLHAYCLRIGYYMSDGRVAEGLGRYKEALVLSKRDFVQMVELCLSADEPRFGVYNCVSAARRPWLSIEKAREQLGYSPRDTVESIFGAVPEQPELGPDDFSWLYGDTESGPEH
ncbi:MAG: NAD(P)-dependent oxidoreductase [Spirochaetaceae bacterium]|nr:MAG: NAD(P)-dependent oxidoreductase [Spirochaetaceae bacterium]